jgi:hypothetical protein
MTQVRWRPAALTLLLALSVTTAQAQTPSPNCPKSANCCVKFDPATGCYTGCSAQSEKTDAACTACEKCSECCKSNDCCKSGKPIKISVRVQGAVKNAPTEGGCECCEEACEKCEKCGAPIRVRVELVGPGKQAVPLGALDLFQSLLGGTMKAGPATDLLFSPTLFWHAEPVPGNPPSANPIAMDVAVPAPAMPPGMTHFWLQFFGQQPIQPAPCCSPCMKSAECCDVSRSLPKKTKPSSDGASKLVIKCYPIDWLCSPMTPPSPAAQTVAAEDRLIKIITHSVHPKSWSCTGGPATIEFYPIGKALVVTQTPEIHEHVAELIAMLRQLCEPRTVVAAPVAPPYPMWNCPVPVYAPVPPMPAPVCAPAPRPAELVAAPACCAAPAAVVPCSTESAVKTGGAKVKGVYIKAKDSGIEITTPDFQATAKAVQWSESEGRVTLEGHVRVLWEKHGTRSQVSGERVTIYLKDGRIDLRAPGSMQLESAARK